MAMDMDSYSLHSSRPLPPQVSSRCHRTAIQAEELRNLEDLEVKLAELFSVKRFYCQLKNKRIGTPEIESIPDWIKEFRAN